MNMHNLPALLRALRDIVAEYDRKAGEIPASLDAFRGAVTALEVGANIGGEYGGSIWERSSPSPMERTLRAVLLKSAWMHVYRVLNIPKIATAADRSRFELSVQNPPEFTLDNIAATFGHYLRRPRFHILRGLAEVFCNLDPAYKSHSKVKIGVAGLPKRIILPNVSDYGSWGYDRLRDTLNALETYRWRPHLDHKTLRALLDDAKEHGAGYHSGVELRRFQNGNAHLIFDPETLREINLALAEFYGDVLPDSPEEAATKKRPGTDVAADLAYYPTPAAVAEEVLRGISWRDVSRVLEPSCGDGRLMEAIRAKAPRAAITGVEVHAIRAAAATAKGFGVMQANFLQVAPSPVFDLVVMNPPFAGQHWQKHLMHARKFLKPCPDGQRWGGGSLICILPATAFYDGHLGKLGLVKKDAHTASRGWVDSGWCDLPVASFAESGTNVPTGYITLHA